MRQVTQRNGKETVKPACILMYNAGMGGVDLIDKKIYHIVAERPTRRYWVEIMRNLLDIALRNSYEPFKLKHPASRLCIRDYISTIVEELGVY